MPKRKPKYHAPRRKGSSGHRDRKALNQREGSLSGAARKAGRPLGGPVRE